MLFLRVLRALRGERLFNPIHAVELGIIKTFHLITPRSSL
jgi:hypothetical protein